MFRSLIAIRRLFATKKYAKSHQWCLYFPEKKLVQVGITDHAQGQLGEIVHFEFPVIGKSLKSADPALTIESVKTAADVISPVTGSVKACNTELETNPTLINQKAEDTWIIEIECDKEPEGLLNADEYKKFLEE